MLDTLHARAPLLLPFFPPITVACGGRSKDASSTPHNNRLPLYLWFITTGRSRFVTRQIRTVGGVEAASVDRPPHATVMGGKDGRGRGALVFRESDKLIGYSNI